MMPRRASAGLLLLLLVAPSLWAEAIDASATILAPVIDLGVVSPVATIEPAPAATSVRVTSSAPWQLSLSSMSHVDEQIAVLVHGEWQPLMTGVPVPVAAGEPTPAEGTMVSVQVRARPNLRARPGRHDVALQLSLNGRPCSGSLRVAFEIPPVVAVEDDRGQFELVADQPGYRQVYDFHPRQYVVRGNVPWRLEVSQRRTTTPAPYVLEVMDAQDDYRALTGTVLVASGNASAQGERVMVRLRVKLGQAAPAGTYSHDVEVQPRISGAGSQ
jgi:hypothetical protein